MSFPNGNPFGEKCRDGYRILSRYLYVLLICGMGVRKSVNANDCEKNMCDEESYARHFLQKYWTCESCQPTRTKDCHDRLIQPILRRCNFILNVIVFRFCWDIILIEQYLDPCYDNIYIIRYPELKHLTLFPHILCKLL